MNIDLNRISSTFADVEFFVAGLFSESAPVFEGEAGNALAVVCTPQFWAVTSKSPRGEGLLHVLEEAIVLFRGYESRLSVHSYSPPAAFAKLPPPNELRNGVFAYIRSDSARQQATLRSDAFGIAPMFYRQVGMGWLVASHPGLIRMSADEPDLMAWAGLLQNGVVPGDRSFYRDIHRFPAGTQMTLWPGRSKTERWFDFSALPEGTKTVDDEAFQRVEDAYLASMARCLKLDLGEVTLPFSSGYDSRRFFSTFQRWAVPFKAVTCQTFHRKNGEVFDIDYFYAPKLARAFGVDCELLPAVPPTEIAADARRRQTLIGSETFMHAWALPLMRWLAKRPPSLVFDGLAGDKLSGSGRRIKGLRETPEKDTELLVEEASNSGVLDKLSARFPTVQDFQQEYRRYLSQFAPNMNRGELSVLESRTRRGISPWVTMMHPPGHVAVFPYCDLEFVRVALEYHPAEKYKWFFQRECLRRFYPDYYEFPGSRDMPKDHAPVSRALVRERERSYERYVYGSPGRLLAALKYLSPANRLLLLLSAAIPAIRRRRGWLFEPLLLLVDTEHEAFSVISSASLGSGAQ